MAKSLDSFTFLNKSLAEWLHKLSGWLLLFAIVWLCWGIARIIWLLLAPPQAPDLPVAQRQVRPPSSINASAALAIFESPQRQQQPTQPPPDVVLAGVMLASPSSLSSAMLSVNGVMANYRIGDRLAETGYRLTKVTWNQAIIADSNNREVVIDMPERMPLDQSEVNNGAAAANSALPNNAGAAAAQMPTMPTPQTASPLSYAENQQETANTTSLPASAEPSPVAALDNAVNELRQNPANYLSNMGVMATGEGYQVTESMPADLRSKLGLEAGDRVLSVNGQNVGSDPASDADILNQVKQSGQATIEVQRGEQVFTVRQQF